MIIRNAAGRAVFNPDKMGKVTLASGEFLYAGLNCFLPGQEHAPHAHAAQDKLYVVMAGSGMVSLGDEEDRLAPGDVVLAKAGVPHGVKNDGHEELVILTLLSPPPKK